MPRPPLGSPVMFEYLRIVRKLSHAPPPTFGISVEISGYAPGPPFRKSCVRHWNRGQQSVSLGPYPARDLKHPSEIP